MFRTVLLNSCKFSQKMGIADCMSDTGVLPVWRPAVMYSSTFKIRKSSVIFHAGLAALLVDGLIGKIGSG